MKKHSKLLKEGVLLKCSLVVVFCFNVFTSLGQLQVNTNSDAAQLVEYFVGESIEVVGAPVKYCNSNGTALFSEGLTTSCPIDSGIVLSTGYASFLNRQHDFSANASLNYGNYDAQLATLTNYSMTDICYIEFDFIPKYDTIAFSYVFGSEEYLEWVNSVFNDVFGFFLSGPNPGGGNFVSENLAVVPGSNDVVSINTINPNSNSSYYLNNAEGNSGCCGFQAGIQDDGFVLDGFTTKMDIGSKVTPCETYTLKIAICDVSDPLLDSYVLLNSKSFVSPGLNVTSNGTIAEGQNAIFDFEFPYDLTHDTTITFDVGGSALSDEDYASFTHEVNILQGESSGSVVIPVFDEDDCGEDEENIIIDVDVSNACIAWLDSDTVTIIPTPNSPVVNTISVTSCRRYTVPSADETYTLSGVYSDTILTDAGCDSILSINLTIIDCPATTFCLNDGFNVSTSGYNVSAGYSQIFVVVNELTGNIVSANSTGSFGAADYGSLVGEEYAVYAVNTNDSVLLTQLQGTGSWQDILDLISQTCAGYIGPVFYISESCCHASAGVFLD